MLDDLFSFQTKNILLGQACNIFQGVLEFALEMLPLYGSVNWCAFLGGIRVAATNVWVDKE